MAQDRNDLPEGTDKIITGASTAGGEEPVAGETATIAERETSGSEVSQRSTAGGSSSAGTRDRMLQSVRSGRDKVAGQAADKARGLVTQGLERSSEALANVGRLVGDTAAGLDERLGPEYGDYARRAAEAIEGTANSLASKDADELIDDTRDFVRKSPAVALAGAAIVGFALARLIKTGLSRGEDESDRSSRRDRS